MHYVILLYVYLLCTLQSKGCVIDNFRLDREERHISCSDFLLWLIPLSGCLEGFSVVWLFRNTRGLPGKHGESDWAGQGQDAGTCSLEKPLERPSGTKKLSYGASSMKEAKSFSFYSSSNFASGLSYQKMKCEQESGSLWNWKRPYVRKASPCEENIPMWGWGKHPYIRKPSPCEEGIPVWGVKLYEQTWIVMANQVPPPLSNDFITEN